MLSAVWPSLVTCRSGGWRFAVHMFSPFVALLTVMPFYPDESLLRIEIKDASFYIKVWIGYEFPMTAITFTY